MLMKHVGISNSIYIICFVCEYNDLLALIYKTSIPNVSLICACCGFQQGYDDETEGYTFEIRRYKQVSEGVRGLI